ncbi:hypothetical protein HKX48_001227 [Thoreauomyces humboldtii]|nr:hypothetical protein HKX48_001227 [Thoreauomyces humboldtii]
MLTTAESVPETLPEGRSTAAVRASKRKQAAQEALAAAEATAAALVSSSSESIAATATSASSPTRLSPPPAPAASQPPGPTIPPTTLKHHIRNLLLPFVLQETQLIAALQARVRNRYVDAFFKYLGALGTHTAFLLLLPCLFWFDSGNRIDIHGQNIDVNRIYGRSLVFLLASGVYLSGAMKDYVGLPRPLSPPVVRMSTHASIDIEYGFPSTHTANAVSLSLFTALFFIAHWGREWSPSAQNAVLAALGIYSVLIAVSRIVTGMHSFLDVAGGAALGALIVGIHWCFVMGPMEEWLMTGWTVPLVMVPLCVLLISIHPDPDGPCPCFDDSVAFIGVMGGLMIGNWHYALHTVGAPLDMPAFALLMAIQRIALGISIIIAWRICAKLVCYSVLPPLYRLLALPFKRKFFALADKDYKSIPASHVSFAPSLLHLPGTSTDVDQAVTAATMRNPDAPVFRLPRYDVDIATKLIVYCGIGWWAVEGIPLIFHSLGM